MASKNQIKFVQSLHRKKYRQRYSQFIVEGEKSVNEVLNSSWRIDSIFATEQWLYNQDITPNIQQVICSQTDLERMAFFKSASPVLAVVNLPDNVLYKPEENWTLLLDGIADPGNLGTIIRIADWYGIKQVICSPNTVDVYNPKCISSTMGSFVRVEVLYTELAPIIRQTKHPVLFTLMHGADVRTQHLSSGLIVIGSEANGISQSLLELPHTAITIPKKGNAESLNAAVATGIICERLIPQL